MKRFFPAVAAVLAAAVGAAHAASISSFSPMYGPTNLPSYVTILGTGFKSATPLKVWFNNTLCTDATATAQDGTQIQARIPFGATTGPIKVQVGSTPVAQSSQIFTVVGPGPFIYSFAPPTGSDNAPVTLVGMHFTGVTNVTFNGRRVQNLQPPTSDEQMQVIAPVGVSTGPIRVQSPQGSWTTSSNFFVPPLITNMTPASGRAGTNIMLRGANFVGTTAIYFGGPDGAFTLPAVSFNVLSNGAVTVTAPPGVSTGRLRLFAPAGSADTTNAFVVQPLITGFNPQSGPENTVVTISGANLNAGTPVVRFNGVTALVTSFNFGQISTRVPGGATTGPISVQTTNGTFVTPNLFYLPPVITSFTPSNSPPGSRITITGQNFTDATIVSFNGFMAEFTVTNNTTIGATVPPGISTGPILVSAPGGTDTSTGLFYAPPVVAGFSPTHGLPGTNVVITGNNFLGATSVRFNTTPAAFTVVNNTTINAIVPTNATSGPVTVAAPAGTNTSVLPFILDYSSDLSVTLSDDPDPVLVTSNLVYTLRVENHGPFPLPDVALTNTLPASVSVVSTATSQGTVWSGDGLVTAQLGAIEVGSAATVTLTVAPQSAGVLSDTVVVTGLHPDPAPGNNTASATTTVQPLPLLSARLVFAGTRVRLAWPLVWDNYSLQFRQELGGAGSWLDVTTPPAQAGGEWTVTETNSGPARFYRLKRNE